MWEENHEYSIKAGFKSVNKNHSEEFDSCFSNLEKLLSILDMGKKIGEFKVSFFRSEGGGVYRIGQTEVAHAKKVRLYLYPDEENMIAYILTIGTDETQQEDINKAKRITKKIKKERG